MQDGLATGRLRFGSRIDRQVLELVAGIDVCVHPETPTAMRRTIDDMGAPHPSARHHAGVAEAISADDVTVAYAELATQGERRHRRGPVKNSQG